MSAQSPRESSEQENIANPNELLERLLAAHEEEVKQKVLDAQVALRSIESNLEYSKHVADLLSQDNARDRELKLELRKTSLKYGVVFAILTVAVIAVAMWLDKEQFVIELVKVFIYGGGGVLIGNFYQKAKQRDKDRDIEDE